MDQTQDFLFNFPGDFTSEELVEESSGVGLIGIVSAATALLTAVVAIDVSEQHPRHQGFADLIDLKSDRDFFRHLRVTRDAFEEILEVIEKAYLNSPKPLLIGPKFSIYVTLWYLGTEITYRELSELFGVAESTVFDCVQRVINVLCLVSRQYIYWPTDDERLAVEQAFRDQAGFPGVIGAVDSSHIDIKAPAQEHADYIDRTQQHSINLMAVCTADMKIRFFQAGFPGSAHDSRVFKNTKLYDRLERNLASLFPSDSYHLIGDYGFALHKYLLVPFRDTGRLTQTEKTFNSKLSKTRVVIENGFGFLKGRFRRLHYVNADAGRISKIVGACCIIHNITLNYPNNETWLEEEGPIHDPQLWRIQVHRRARNDQGGQEKRRIIAEMLGY